MAQMVVFRNSGHPPVHPLTYDLAQVLPVMVFVLLVGQGEYPLVRLRERERCLGGEIAHGCDALRCWLSCDQAGVGQRSLRRWRVLQDAKDAEFLNAEM
jgi:hypothetical protein